MPNHVCQVHRHTKTHMVGQDANRPGLVRCCICHISASRTLLERKHAPSSAADACCFSCLASHSFLPSAWVSLLPDMSQTFLLLRLLGLCACAYAIFYTGCHGSFISALLHPHCHCIVSKIQRRIQVKRFVSVTSSLLLRTAAWKLLP